MNRPEINPNNVRVTVDEHSPDHAAWLAWALEAPEEDRVARTADRPGHPGEDFRIVRRGSVTIYGPV